ncbi:MAG: type VI secretion system Hcp family effector [Marinobacter psychrophilus]|jgi:type VI secretion system Hcp family effector
MPTFKHVTEQTMPTPCYINIEGQTQGHITAGAFTADSVGNIYVEGHEDEILVQAFSHVVTVPTDPQTVQVHLSSEQSHTVDVQRSGVW